MTPQSIPLALGCHDICTRHWGLVGITQEVAVALGPRQSQATYEDFVAGPRQTLPQPRHMIIVSSKDEKNTSEDVLTRIRKVADAKKSGLTVETVRKARNQNVVISCESESALTRLTEKLKNEDKLRIDPAKNKDPLVIIKNVLAYNTDEDILASIKSQNKEALKDIADNEYRAVIKYRRTARNSHETHIVMQVSPKLWQRLTTMGRIHIDLQRCLVADQSPLVQCTRCLGFGHGKKLCKESVDMCSHCAGPHLRAQCPSYAAGDTACCRNCQIGKIERSEHSAFDKECPIRRKWDTIARASVAYC
ncbi:jg24594 [Pararge aegeria aegeria]|uniref:Jg24594 protein n=1 Tax=Pararge aegeria aegeria TaxID=348720 RepID=A0A8S4QZW7_9NEOP|nr:jg24594 [Pararge aegeria aegeria]